MVFGAALNKNTTFSQNNLQINILPQTEWTEIQHFYGTPIVITLLQYETNVYTSILTIPSTDKDFAMFNSFSAKC